MAMYDWDRDGDIDRRDEFIEFDALWRNPDNDRSYGSSHNNKPKKMSTGEIIFWVFAFALCFWCLPFGLLLIYAKWIITS